MSYNEFIFEQLKKEEFKKEFEKSKKIVIDILRKYSHEISEETILNEISDKDEQFYISNVVLPFLSVGNEINVSKKYSLKKGHAGGARCMTPESRGMRNGKMRN